MDIETDVFLMAYNKTIELNRFKEIQYNCKIAKVDMIEMRLRSDWYGVRDFIYLLKGNNCIVSSLPIENKNKYTFKIREINYQIPDKKICSIVKDIDFFKIEDRQLALSRILKEDAEFLIELGYLKWNDYQIINFLTKRIIKQTKK